MQEKMESCNPGMLCDTLFFQGIGTSQTQILKYTGNQRVKATTGQSMWSAGCNQLEPLSVIYNPHIGEEVQDINLHINSFWSYVNPLNIIGLFITWGAMRYYDFHFTDPIPPNNESVGFYAPNIFRMSVGQNLDMETHRRKYDAWKAKEDKNSGLVLWGVSRGTAATFCAFAKEQYPEVKLVVLEGAIDSVQNILAHYARHIPNERVAKTVTQAVNAGLAFFKRKGYIAYDPEGPSPLKSVDTFPEGVPVVFITSKIDAVVPCTSTERIANALAAKGKNEVYLLNLERSSHPNYMYDDPQDRNKYETLIHAVYKKYNLKHDSNLAAQGGELLEQCRINMKPQLLLPQLAEEGLLSYEPPSP
jgi:hypothetical protein